MSASLRIQKNSPFTASRSGRAIAFFIGARQGKKVLVIDFDPQCNLSIAMLGSEEFKKALPTTLKPYGTTVRAYLQKFLQGIGDLELYTYHGKHTDKNVDLIAGDFWLNVYGESLSVGSGLKVSNLYISQIKRKCGIEVGKNYNLPKSEDSRQPQCPPEKEKAIREAFKYFGMI